MIEVYTAVRKSEPPARLDHLANTRFENGWFKGDSSGGDPGFNLQMNDLHARPEWYNALTRNCTTAIPTRDGNAPRRCPRTWKVVLPGYLPSWIYDQGVLDTSLPFAELQKRSHVNERGQAADKDPNFSVRIREGLPKPEPRK